MRKVTVIYPRDDEKGREITQSFFLKDRKELNDDTNHTGEVTSMPADHVILEHVYRLMNVVNGDEIPTLIGCRSMSVGDLVNIKDSDGDRWYVCDNIGFTKVSNEFVTKWVLLPFSKRSFGIKWAKEKGWVS